MTAPLLEATNLQFAYGDRPVLRDVSLTLARGEVVALLGPNGTGKSTLIRVLLGHLRADRGQVLWENRDVRAWPRRAFARRVAYLPQSPTADPDQRVADVLRTGRAPYWGAFGLESAHDVAIVSDVARQLDLIELLPRPMAELSGGQRQLVFLARCLVQQPVALLLDEPNTFLDLRHQVDLGQRLRRLAKEQGLAVLMASHDLNLAGALADRLILLDAGVVAAEGSADRVLDPQVVGKVYGLPMRRLDVPGQVQPLIWPDLR
ncbi:MAG TPA: ABC transporter ATP-binding protein [Tepidisphaeraceae bacterium]|jgi:iron complex transport system ATP-binding protein